jgi:AcrR family transcriptional regulator
MQHKRAVNVSEKQERRTAILNAAMELFLASSFDAVTMQAVADKAGIAKGTSYLYFRSKEEVFLALLNEEVARWLKVLRDGLAGMPAESAPAAELARSFGACAAASVQNMPGFTRLVALVHAILEQNLTPAVALSYKRRLRMRFLTAGLQIETALPFLKGGQGAELLLTIYALLIGLQGLAEPPAAVAQAMQEGDLGLFRVDLANSLGIAVERLALGMAEQG